MTSPSEVVEVIGDYNSWRNRVSTKDPDTSPRAYQDHLRFEALTDSGIFEAAERCVESLRAIIEATDPSTEAYGTFAAALVVVSAVADAS